MGLSHAPIRSRHRSSNAAGDRTTWSARRATSNVGSARRAEDAKPIDGRLWKGGTGTQFDLCSVRGIAGGRVDELLVPFDDPRGDEVRVINYLTRTPQRVLTGLGGLVRPEVRGEPLQLAIVRAAKGKASTLVDLFYKTMELHLLNCLITAHIGLTNENGLSDHSGRLLTPKRGRLGHTRLSTTVVNA